MKECVAENLNERIKKNPIEKKLLSRDKMKEYVFVQEIGIKIDVSEKKEIFFSDVYAKMSFCLRMICFLEYGSKAHSSTVFTVWRMSITCVEDMPNDATITIFFSIESNFTSKYFWNFQVIHRIETNHLRCFPFARTQEFSGFPWLPC